VGSALAFETPWALFAIGNLLVKLALGKANLGVPYKLDHNSMHCR
jgi:hypothetical protein